MEWMIFTDAFCFKTILNEFCNNKMVYFGSCAVFSFVAGNFLGSRQRAGWDIGGKIYWIFEMEENRIYKCVA